MKQTGDGEMVARCVSTWQTLDSNYAVVKVLFKPDVNETDLLFSSGFHFGDV
jgi:hypothetical protein